MLILLFSVLLCVRNSPLGWMITSSTKRVRAGLGSLSPGTATMRDGTRRARAKLVFVAN
jgi:hypothetical protein